MAKEKVHGYLPDEKPPVGKLLLYALQQVIVMFPATITVALITGFQVSTTIFASGIATLCFILITGRKIPFTTAQACLFVCRHRSDDQRNGYQSSYGS